MTKKKAFAVLLTILLVSVSLTMPVSAQQAPVNPVVYLNGVIQPFWDTVNSDVYLALSISGDKVTSKIMYSPKSGATVEIYKQKPERFTV